jgi:hypothetical protein
VTPWITAILGAIAALIVGLILTALGGALWSNALSDLLNNALAGTSGSSAGTLGDFTGVAQQVLSPDLLKLFALAHHVSLNVGSSASATLASANGSLSLGIPLTGLFLAPALALTLGGYIAASSDFSRRARYSIARGALIAPFYAVLLVICALIGSSTASASGSAAGLLQGSGSVTIAPSVGEAALYGLLWGLLFGALGGWIHVSGRVWLSSALATLQTVRNGRLAGALAGAGAALVTGIVLFSAAFIGVEAFGGISGAAASTAAAGSAPSIVTTLTLYLFFAPVAAVYFFALGTGAPIGAFVTDSTNQLNSSVTVSLLNGYQTTAPTATSGAATPVATPLPHFPPSPVFYLLILGALISYLVGGRVAARVARARLAGDGFVAGALMAVPLSLLMTFAAYLATAVLTISVSTGGQSETLGVSASPVYGGMFLAVLIAGAVCGGIGGASVSAMPGLGALPHALLLPFRPVSRLLSPLLDGLTGRDRRQPPSLATQWIYDGVGAAVVLGILAIALDILNGAAPKLLPFAALWLVEAIVAALLVGVPLACFLGALLAAFMSPAPLAPAPMLPPLPAPPSVPAYATVPASIPGMYAPSMPLPQYPPSPQYPQYPQYSQYSQYPPTPAPTPTQPESPPPAMPDYGASSPGTPPQPPF